MQEGIEVVRRVPVISISQRTTIGICTQINPSDDLDNTGMVARREGGNQFGPIAHRVDVLGRCRGAAQCSTSSGRPTIISRQRLTTPVRSFVRRLLDRKLQIVELQQPVGLVSGCAERPA